MATKVLLVAIALNGRTVKIAGPFSYSNAWTFVETTLDLIGKTGIEMGLEIFDHSTKEERQSFVTTRDGATFIELGKKNWNRTPPIRFEFTLHTWYQQSSASEPSNDEGNRPTIVDIENMVENATLEYYNTHQKQLMVENACKNSVKLHSGNQNKVKDPTDLPNESDSAYSKIHYIVNTFIDGEFICASEVISGADKLFKVLTHMSDDICEYLKKEGFIVQSTADEGASRYDAYDLAKRYTMRISAQEPSIPVMCYTSTDESHIENWPNHPTIMHISLIGCEVKNEIDAGATILGIERALRDKCWDMGHNPLRSICKSHTSAENQVISETNDIKDTIIKAVDASHNQLKNRIENILKSGKNTSGVLHKATATKDTNQHPFGYDKE